MEPGYYAVRIGNEVVPARHDGKDWHHAGTTFQLSDLAQVLGPIQLACQTGCKCTVNPDGTVTINCKGQ